MNINSHFRHKILILLYLIGKHKYELVRRAFRNKGGILSHPSQVQILLHPYIASVDMTSRGVYVSFDIWFWSTQFFNNAEFRYEVHSVILVNHLYGKQLSYSTSMFNITLFFTVVAHTSMLYDLLRAFIYKFLVFDHCTCTTVLSSSPYNLVLLSFRSLFLLLLPPFIFINGRQQTCLHPIPIFSSQAVPFAVSVHLLPNSHLGTYVLRWDVISIFHWEHNYTTQCTTFPYSRH